MDKTGVFILGVMVLGIIWSVVKTALKIWEYNTYHPKQKREDKYSWNDFDI